VASCLPFVNGEEGCDLFWETETQIGSDIPSPVITEGAKEGSAYPDRRSSAQRG